MLFISIIWIFIVVQFSLGEGRCFFPGELQGVWSTQRDPDVGNSPIDYFTVNITSSSISLWGECYKKQDDNIILADRPPLRQSPCYRCFRLVVASVNVAALLSSGVESCFLSAEVALASCPTSEAASVHISLFKNPLNEATEIKEVQCPLSGMYHFSYFKGNKSRRELRPYRCEQPTSEMSNCPFGFTLRLQYRDCTFEQPRTSEWHCLGSWRGLNGQMYTAMWDRAAKDGAPKYKCGIYKHEKEKVYLAFSKDSTCINDLFSAEDGYERYILNKVPRPPLPSIAERHNCHFPANLKGHWHNLHIKTNVLTFRDERNLEVLHMKCMIKDRNSNKYVVHARNNCGKAFYTCISLMERSPNILEIKIGKEKPHHDHRQCNDLDYSEESSWITLARKEKEVTAPCPILGTYRGNLPDAPGYCAELYSDCSRTDIMHHSVDECGQPHSIYERRKDLEAEKKRLLPSIVEVGRDGDKFNSNAELRPSAVESTFRFGSRDRSLKELELRFPLQFRNKRSAVYHVSNPKTTTISYNWGSSLLQSSSSTTPLPTWTKERSSHYWQDSHNERLNRPSVFNQGSFFNNSNYYFGRRRPSHPPKSPISPGLPSYSSPHSYHLSYDTHHPFTNPTFVPRRDFGRWSQSSHMNSGVNQQSNHYMTPKAFEATASTFLPNSGLEVSNVAGFSVVRYDNNLREGSPQIYNAFSSKPLSFSRSNREYELSPISDLPLLSNQNSEHPWKVDSPPNPDRLLDENYRRYDTPITAPAFNNWTDSRKQPISGNKKIVLKQGTLERKLTRY